MGESVEERLSRIEEGMNNIQVFKKVERDFMLLELDVWEWHNTDRRSQIHWNLLSGMTSFMAIGYSMLAVGITKDSAIFEISGFVLVWLTAVVILVSSIRYYLHDKKLSKKSQKDNMSIDNETK